MLVSDIQYNYTQHRGLVSGIQHNDTVIMLNVVVLSVAFYLLKCWMSLCWTSLCWASWRLLRGRSVVWINLRVFTFLFSFIARDQLVSFSSFQIKMSMRKESPPERKFIHIKLEDFAEGIVDWVWVNQRLYFPLSAMAFPLHFPLSAPMLMLIFCSNVTFSAAMLR